MKIGRRAFLQFLGSAIAGAQIDAHSKFYSSDTHYIDRELGFGFEIPKGWFLETFRKDFPQLLGGQQLAEEWRDEEGLLEELGEGLIATLSKYPIVGSSPNRFSPSITFFRDDDSALEDYDDLKDLAEHAILGFSSVLTDYQCTNPPKLIKRSDCTLIRARSKFLFEHRDISPVMIDDEAFIIHHESKIYTIHLYDSPYTGDSSQREFTTFRESLHIA